MNQVGLGNGADLLGDQIPQGLDQFLAAFLAGHQRYIRVDALALHVMLVTDHGGFGDAGVQHQGRFDFGGAQAVAGHVEHVVHPAGDPVVAIFITAGPVTSEIAVLVGAEVGVDQALMIAIHGTNLAGPAGLDDQVAGGRAVQFLAIRVHQAGLHTEHGQGG